MPELPDQPDGIEDDSRDLPNPTTAAERVNQYICAAGDGLYDIQGGAPLYARDLEAITRAVLDQATALKPAQPLPVADGSEAEASCQVNVWGGPYRACGRTLVSGKCGRHG